MLAVFSHILINVVLFLLILLALHVPESNLRFTLTGISMHMTLLPVSIDHENRESAEFFKLNRLRDRHPLVILPSFLAPCSRNG